MKGTLLHLIDTGGPGGAETVYLRVAAGLQARGWRAIPVVNRDAWLAARLREAGLEPVILDSKGSMNLEYLYKLCALIRSSRADAILTHLYGSAVYGAMAGRWTGKPVISVLHGHSDIGAGERLAWLKGRIVSRGTARLVAVSAPLRNALAVKIKAPPEHWIVIPNGVDTDLLKPGGSCGLRERLGIPDQTLLVGALGNIRKPKAYDVFLETANRLAGRLERCHFVIAGEGYGPLMDELLALRKRLGLEHNVHFVGLQPDIAGYLGELDIFLLSSSTEGFSIACVEAMACGLPVVATRSGGPETIVIDGETGVLCPVGDPEALAVAIAQLAVAPLRRRQMGEAGRRRAENQFGLAAMLDNYEVLLDDVHN